MAALTSARIALGRSGASLPTREVLGFGLAHARARDAVHQPMDEAAVAAAVRAAGFEPLALASRAASRSDYLRRPDLGRRLDERDRERAAAHRDAQADLAVVIGDGLSARAVNENAGPFLARLRPRLEAAGLRAAGHVPVVANARVAVGDEIAELMEARAVLMLIGERPGLSSPDSLGLYLTAAPRLGRSDAERNCISNVRPAGLSFDRAAHKAVWLLMEARRRGATGVALKDESDREWLSSAPGPGALADDR
nr:ethanolamine ammonia-lyase subunit EutC [Aureimonas populi]